MRLVPTRRALRIAARCAFAVWLLGTAALVWVMLIYPHQTQAAPNKDFLLTRAANSDLSAWAEQLAEARVIRLPRAFVWYVRLRGVEADLRSGDVVVNRALSVFALMPRLARGLGPAVVRVVIPEGFTRFDVARRLARFGICDERAFRSVSRDPATLTALGIPGESAEGYLFPASYHFTQDRPAHEVLATMVRVFRERTRARFARYEQAHDGAELALSPHDILTLASIVEREAHVPEERPRIAGVFMNRLTSPTFRPRRLQADPTVAYGCLAEPERSLSCQHFDGRRVTPEMVRDPDNRYSTYRHEGLPPGPICNPGLAALDAALTPEAHEFFYFVAKGAGRHAFARTLEEHNRAVHGAH